MHMGLDLALFTIKDHDKVINEIKDFMFDELDEVSNFALHSWWRRLNENMIIEYSSKGKTDCSIVNILVDFLL